MIRIVDRWNPDRVIYECEAETLREAVLKAVRAGVYLSTANLRGANLRYALLRDADLSYADLSGANLCDADLRAANLRAANLSEADLSDANLGGADLRAANLSAANLSAANLSGANLSTANLSAANLRAAKTDLFAVLDRSPKEVAGLLAALREGRVDGSVYHGDCACLVGTLANVRGCDIDGIEGLVPDSSRPAERWFLAIMQGHTPANHPISKLTEEWVIEWMRAHEQPIPKTLAEVLGSVRLHPGESLVAIAERLVAAAGSAS